MDSGCDHKCINPSSQGSTVDDGRAEDARMAMRAAAGRRCGNNVAEFIRVSFFQQSRHVGDECDLPRRVFLGDPGTASCRTISKGQSSPL